MWLFQVISRPESSEREERPEVDVVEVQSLRSDLPPSLLFVPVDEEDKTS